MTSLQATRLTVLALTVATACGPAAEPVDLAGTCLYVSAEMPEATAARLEYQHPPLVYLDTAATGRGNLRRLAELPGSLPSVHGIAGWRSVEGDSVELIWSTGFDAILVRLPAAAGTLHGRVELQTDDGNDPGYGAPASAVRIPCDAPIAAEHRRRHPDLPAVTVAGGAPPLRIGSQFDQVRYQFEILGYERYFLHEEPQGMFAGADSLIVTTDVDNVIGAIRLTYRDGAAARRIIDQLRGEHGEPASGDESRAAAWRDRERRMEVRGHRTSAGVEVLIADPRVSP